MKTTTKKKLIFAVEKNVRRLLSICFTKNNSAFGYMYILGLYIHMYLES